MHYTRYQETEACDDKVGCLQPRLCNPSAWMPPEARGLLQSRAEGDNLGSAALTARERWRVARQYVPGKGERDEFRGRVTESSMTHVAPAQRNRTDLIFGHTWKWLTWRCGSRRLAPCGCPLHVHQLQPCTSLPLKRKILFVGGRRGTAGSRWWSDWAKRKKGSWPGTTVW